MVAGADRAGMVGLAAYAPLRAAAAAGGGSGAFAEAFSSAVAGKRLRRLAPVVLYRTLGPPPPHGPEDQTWRRLAGPPIQLDIRELLAEIARLPQRRAFTPNTTRREQNLGREEMRSNRNYVTVASL